MTLYSTICVQDHSTLRAFKLLLCMAHIFLSHYGKACASLTTLLEDYQISPFFKTRLYVCWCKFYCCIFCHTTCTLFINAYCQFAYIKINISFKRFVACISFMFHCFVHNSKYVELQEPNILSFNLFFQFNTLFSFVLIVCRLLDFLEHFVGFSTQGVILGKAWPATSWEKCQGLDQQYM